jgi:hypothetical protein
LQLKQAVHSARDEAIVEVWDADKRTLIGVLYPTPTGVKFVSKFITNHPHLVVIDPCVPPAVLISLALIE